MRPPVASKPPERALGSGPMLQRCVEKIMQRANVSETDARHVLRGLDLSPVRREGSTGPERPPWSTPRILSAYKFDGF